MGVKQSNQPSLQERKIKNDNIKNRQLKVINVDTYIDKLQIYGVFFSIDK